MKNDGFKLATLAWLALALLPTLGQSQVLPWSSSIDTSFVPDSAFASVTIFPKKIAEDPNLDLFPREIVTAWGKKEFGFDPMLLKQITFVMETPKNMMALQQGPPKWSAILHFEEMQGLNGNLIDRLEQKRMGNRTLYSSPEMGQPSFLVYDEATMFVGDESLFEAMTVASGKSALVQMMKSSKAKAQALTFVDVETVRPMLNEMMAQMPGMLPPAINKLKQLPDMLKGVEFSMHVENSLATNLKLHFRDTESAEKAEKIIADAIDLGKDLAIGGAATQFDLSDSVQAATVDYIQRMGEEYSEKLTPTLSGSSLNLQVANETAVIPVAIGMLLPAVQQARAAARRAQSMNNMRQMGLAAHNYESAMRGFPAAANYDENGKPLLSWRVHILPYIDEQELYEQFHLDEPWDSPHNRKLIDRMPMVYASPSVDSRGGKTVYLGNAGENGIFGKKKRQLGEITDGTSNTAMIIEVDPSMAVEWTRPADYEMNPRNPMAGLGGVNPGGFNVNFADGSVRFISMSIDPEVWKGLLTINGGEVSNGDY